MTLISLQNVKKYRLANGLDVLLEVNNAMPVVSINVGVKVGSVWETEAEAGLSHLLEHMVFKGTKSFGPGEIAQLVEGSGGEINAYTSLDQTVYFINLSARTANLGLNLIKEMVFDATIDSAELAREKEVVLEEIRRGKDNPHKLAGEALFGLAYRKHPYGRPVIGYEETVRNFSRETVAEFYHRWYSPSNMVLGICGDFDPEKIKQQIEAEFGSIADRPVARPNLTDEPLPLKPHFLTLANPVEGTYLNLAFPIPSFVHPDIAALDLLSHLLGDGETSRLEQIVKEKKGLANSIHSYAFTPRFPGLFVIDAQVPAQKASRALSAILEEIEFFKKNLAPAENLARSKLNLKSSVFYEKETCEGTARKWMLFETTAGDYRFEEEYMNAIDRVTEYDIRRAANQYLEGTRASSVLLHPEKQKIKFSFPSGTKQKRRRGGGKPATLVETMGDIQKFRLANGAIVLLRENHRVPLVSLKMAANGGLRFETPANNGVSQLLAGMLGKGTTSKSALKIAEIIESIAGHVEGYSGRNSWGISAGFLSEKTGQGVDLFCDVLMNPAFDTKEFAKERRLTLEAIKNQEDSLSHIAFEKFQALLFKKHPYGLPLMGTRQSVKSISLNQVKKFYAGLMDPRQMVFCAVGDFQTEFFLEMLAPRLLKIKPKRLRHPLLRAEAPPSSIQKVEVKKEKMQAHLVVGFLGTTLNHPDRYAFEVLNNILSGQGGRLFLELRDKQSLAYTVSSALVEGIEAGFFSVYMGTEPRKIPTALEGILKELEKIRTEKISETELNRAKNYVVGNYDIDLQRNSAVSSTLAFNELYGSGLAEFENYPKNIMKVTSDEVLETARKYLTLDRYVLSIVQP